MGIDFIGLAGLVTAIGGLLGVYLTWKRLRAEISVERVRVGAELTDKIIAQADTWLSHQEGYVKKLTDEVAQLRAEIAVGRERMRRLEEEIEQRDKANRAEMERRDEIHLQYIRYLLHNITELTEQVCDAGQKPRVVSMTYEEFIRDL